MTLRSQRLQTMEQVRTFLESSEAVDYRHMDRADAHALVWRTLIRLRRTWVAERGEDQKLDALPSSERLLLDLIRMIYPGTELRMVYKLPGIDCTTGKNGA